MQWKKCTFSFNSEYIIGGIFPSMLVMLFPFVSFCFVLLLLLFRGERGRGRVSRETERESIEGG